MLILIGATVRATGSGLGCPDWPKCFGMWIPPTEVSQLPINYQEIFKIGDKTIAPFSAFKTWTEYLNRLAGMLVGLIVIFLMYLGFKNRKTHKTTFRKTISLFLLVSFQGWIGAKVVSSYLAPYMITIHMILALIVTFLVINIYLDLNPKHIPNSKLHLFSKILMGLGLIQLILGTQTRQLVDEIKSITPRSLWFESLDPVLLIHRISAVVLALLVCYLTFKYRDLFRDNKIITNLWMVILVLIGLNYLSGTVFKHLNFPAWNQPLHLLFACMLLSAIYSLYSITKKTN